MDAEQRLDGPQVRLEHPVEEDRPAPLVADRLPQAAGEDRPEAVRVPVVERTYPLRDAAEAHRRSDTGRVRGKLVLLAG